MAGLARVSPVTLGYFGPAGTFTHQALLTLGSGEGEAEHRPFPSVVATLNAVRSGEVDAALVPIENSLEGGVSATLDNLATQPLLRIVREVLLPVQFGLYGRPGTRLDEVRQVVTHPHAAAQVRNWMAAQLPEAVVTEQGSTAGAAAEVADPASRFQGAVCARVAGDMYGLVELAANIADNASAVTRFVLVSRTTELTAPTGADKTTLVLYARQDRPGGLLEMLEQFASRGVNLTRLESRPTKEMLGQYCFSMDAEGHLEDERVAETLLGLKRICRDVVFLGSYPRADGEESTIGLGASDWDYRRARDWLDGLRG